MKQVNIDKLKLRIVEEIKLCKDIRMDAIKRKDVTLQHYFHGRIIALKLILNELGG